MKCLLSQLALALIVIPTIPACSESEKRPPAGIGRTYSEVMAGIDNFQMTRVYSHGNETIWRGTRGLARLDVTGGAVGDPVQKVMLAIAINPDNPAGLDENVALFLRVLDNCLPDWDERSEWAYAALEKVRKDPNAVVTTTHKGRNLVILRIKEAGMVQLGIGGAE